MSSSTEIRFKLQTKSPSSAQKFELDAVAHPAAAPRHNLPALPLLLPLPRKPPRLPLFLFLFLFSFPALLKKIHFRPAAQPLSSQQALQLPCQAEGCDL